MKYFEKAVEDYGKWFKVFAPLHWEREILDFTISIHKMIADGKCPESSNRYFSCSFCPLRMAKDKENLNIRCDKIKPEAIRHIISMEVSE